MKAIKLINPHGDVKEFSNVEFYGFKDQVADTVSFKSWAASHNVCGRFTHNGKEVLNTQVIEAFLIDRGYKWENQI